MTLSRRSLLLGAGALTVAGALAASFMLADTGDSDISYPHVTLDSGTLDQYPDTAEIVPSILQSEEFSDKYVVVEYVADWCPYCAALKPEMEEALDNLAEDGLDVARLTVVIQEGNPVTHERGEMAYLNAYQYMTRNEGSGGIPHVQLWKDGDSLGFFTGAQNAPAIENFIVSAIDGQRADPQIIPIPAPE